MSERGRIIQSTGKWYKIRTGSDVIDARLRGKLRLNKKEVTNPVAVGDFVEFERGTDGTAMILTIEERKNYIPRKATHGRRGEQTLVANIDRAWIVTSIRNPATKQGMIDRFLVTCEAYDVQGGIIINKMDLADQKDLEHASHLKRLYTELGTDVCLTSATNQNTREEILPYFTGQVNVFIGPSGTGKTSLLNMLKPGLNLKVGEVSGYSNKGKHTTTYAQLIPLETDGFIADTPGIRELGLVHIEPYELSLYFPEMRDLRQECKYYNCTHSHEPGCAVIDAVHEGLIDTERYLSYLSMLDSIE